MLNDTDEARTDTRPRVALVTGGTSGIGKAVAVRLASHGYRVAVCSRSPRGRSAHDDWLEIQCDVRSPGEVASAVDRVRSSLGRIDLLVNAAGVSMPESLNIGAISGELWDSILRTNVDGTFHMCSAVLPAMRDAGSGQIINVGSTAAWRSSAGNAPYCASKYAVRSLTEALQAECDGTGIRVGSVSPGPVDTPIWNLKTRDVGSQERSRMLSAEDVADVVEFLITRPAHVRIGDVLIQPSKEPRA